MNARTLSALKRQIAAVLAAFCGVSCALSQGSKPQHAKLSLISGGTSLESGSSQWIGLRFELEPGWHIYWTNPGDSGEPPKVTWQLSNGAQAGDLQFPGPQRISDHGLVDYGYQGDVILLSKLTLPRPATSNKVEVGADVKYLVCREVCVPGKDHLSLSLPVDGDAKSLGDAVRIRQAEGRLPQPVPSSVRLSVTPDRDSFVVRIDGEYSRLGRITDFIPADAQVIENSAQPELLGSPLFIRLKKSEQLDHPISQLRGLLIAGDKAYTVTIPVSSSGKSAQKTGSRKTFSQQIPAPKKNQE